MQVFRLTADGRDIAKAVQIARRDEYITEDMAELMIAMLAKNIPASVLKPHEDYPIQVKVGARLYGEANRHVASRFVYALQQAQRLDFMKARPTTGRNMYGAVEVSDLTPQGQAKAKLLQTKAESFQD